MAESCCVGWVSANLSDLDRGRLLSGESLPGIMKLTFMRKSSPKYHRGLLYVLHMYGLP